MNNPTKHPAAKHKDTATNKSVTHGHGVSWMPAPYNNRACGDYIAYNTKELYEYFGVTKHGKGVYDDNATYGLAYSIFRRLGALDVLDGSIGFRHIHNFQVEIVTYLAKNLAVYLIAPQRYNHRSRNMLASAVMKFMYRIERFRIGHNLPSKTRYPLGKKEFGYVIDFINDSEYLWTLAEYWVQRYHKRLKRGLTYEI